VSAVERLDRRGGWVELLRPLGWLFGAASEARRRLYDRGLLPSARVDVPVVCVGNIVAGGTGKTPVTADLVQRFVARGWRPGILVRGYGKAGVSGAEADEARLFAELAPDVPLVAQPDRIEGARRLIERGADVVVMDDGFQHRRLARDLDLVLVDAMRPWGLAQGPRAFLPRGLLREAPAALRRADVLVLTRTDAVAPAALAALEAELEALAPGVPRGLTRHAPVGLRTLEGQAEPLAALDGAVVDCASALGAPAGFEATLRGLGAELGRVQRFPDHHEYTAADFADRGGDDGRRLVVTAKDAVKLRTLDAAGGLPQAVRANLRVLDVALEWLRGEDELDALLAALPEGRARRERGALHEGLHG